MIHKKQGIINIATFNMETKSKFAAKNTLQTTQNLSKDKMSI